MRIRVEDTAEVGLVPQMSPGVQLEGKSEPEGKSAENIERLDELDFGDLFKR